MDDFTSEYTTVFRVSHSTTPPTDYNFLPQNEHAITAQYAREMTLASGRTVYEVWVRSSPFDHETQWLTP